MHKAKALIIDLTLLFIITVPAFIRILNNQYFSMHDDQHIVRLYLLDQGLRQGYLYPRWVDELGFGFGYPLYNFYPPLVYYLAESFHLLGFSLIWAIKLVFIFGFYLGAVGIYLLVKKLTNRISGFLSATLYTYFFYHAVLIYVRGALAEFFSLAILPFIFLTLENLANETNWRNGILFGVSFALLILTHPLIALPSIIFVGFLFLFYLLRSKHSSRLIYLFICGLSLGLALSAFFWLPSLMEKKYTLVDKVLISELADYKLHYIYPQQFIYSPWGYGGSSRGLSDGFTFQLGKIHLGLVFGSIILSIFYITIMSLRVPPKAGRGNPFLVRLLHFVRNDELTKHFYFFIFLLLFSLFMTTEYSSFIWDKLKYLWYLQFPWRFLTFTAIFISIVGGFFLYFLSVILNEVKDLLRMQGRKPVARFFEAALLRMTAVISLLIIAITIITYQKYFKPQRFINTTDKERTSFEEITWRISRTSYEFVPKEVKTKKSELNTTILTIEKKDLPSRPLEILSGAGNITILKNKFQEKEFFIDAKTPLTFRLNTFNFPGWKAYLTPSSVIPSTSTSLSVNSVRNLNTYDTNDLKLITVNVPSGKHNLRFNFEDTNIRKVANIISVTTFALITLLLFYQFKKVDR